MMLFDLNNDILIKIQEELAIKRKHKLFLSNLINHRDQFYIDGDFSNFDLDCFEDHLDFKDGYWYEGVYCQTHPVFMNNFYNQLDRALEIQFN